MSFFLWVVISVAFCYRFKHFQIHINCMASYLKFIFTKIISVDLKSMLGRSYFGVLLTQILEVFHGAQALGELYILQTSIHAWHFEYILGPQPKIQWITFFCHAHPRHSHTKSWLSLRHGLMFLNYMCLLRSLFVARVEQGRLFLPFWQLPVLMLTSSIWYPELLILHSAHKNDCPHIQMNLWHLCYWQTALQY